MSALGKHVVGRSKFTRALHVGELPQSVLSSEYAVRGEIVTLAGKIQQQLVSGTGNYKFDKLIPCNIGNPQAVGQEPLTYHRQVLQMMLARKGHSAVDKAVPADVAQVGEDFVNMTPGAYTDSRGHMMFREKVAQYIDSRDKGVERTAKVDHIYLTDGASPSVKTVIEILIRDSNDAILIPIPQYPLYSASITRAGGTWIGYELSEDYSAANPSWALDKAVVEKEIKAAKENGKNVRAIAVINPGNPTGNVLSREDQRAVCELAKEHNLVILADEVYQENIYAQDKTFTSFREVLLSDFPEGSMDSVSLFSFHSISKGYYGECGIRGGYMHLTNIDPEVNEQIYKLMSMCLCSNVVGQAMVASVMNPPSRGDESYELFQEERSAILSSLKTKAIMVHKRLNEMKGVQCMPIEGAMYAFPKVDLPPKYIEHARSQSKEPDALYCIDVLEKLGVIMVPGNGFGQKVGTYHFRMTILPQEAELTRVLDELGDFQDEMHRKYA
jgi:alanine transaminase